MREDTSLDIAFRFVESINRRDLSGIVALMTEDHTFVDLEGEAHQGRAVMQEVWDAYLTSCPDYMIHLCEHHLVGDTVMLVGRTTGCHLRLAREVEFRDRLIWAARIRGRRVAEWRIHPDTDEVREELGILGAAPEPLEPGPGLPGADPAVHAVLSTLHRLATRCSDVRALALIGSHARGEARDDSDVDVLLLTSQPDRYLQDTAWTSILGDIASVRTEPYGRVTSLRVHLARGPEVEIGISTPDWADVPPDSGTEKVTADGMVAMHDPDGILGRLIEAVDGTPPAE